MAEKNTPLVCGGIYRTKNKKAASVYTAMVISIVEQSNGRSKLGLLHVIGFANERVSEGSDRLNEFELIHNPIPPTTRKKRPAKKTDESK